MSDAAYEVTVSAFGLDEAAQEALFDRVADAAHLLDEQVTCSARLRREPTDEEWAAYAEACHDLYDVASEFGVDLAEEECHCGQPVAYGFDGDPSHHRGMCEDCDAARCDAYPMECPHREGRT